MTWLDIFSTKPLNHVRRVWAPIISSSQRIFHGTIASLFKMAVPF
jgi:hypothetical protein